MTSVACCTASIVVAARPVFCSSSARIVGPYWLRPRTSEIITGDEATTECPSGSPSTALMSMTVTSRSEIAVGSDSEPSRASRPRSSDETRSARSWLETKMNQGMSMVASGVNSLRKRSTSTSGESSATAWSLSKKRGAPVSAICRSASSDTCAPIECAATTIRLASRSPSRRSSRSRPSRAKKALSRS